jgi:4a-hydroxytetrahydrobiopterin dehydratase
MRRDGAAVFRQPAVMATLNASQLRAALATVPAWTKRGKTITRTFQFKDFAAAMKFVNAVARRAEKAWHHPDIEIRWNKVTLTLTTHSAGGLTEKDFELARQFDRLA